MMGGGETDPVATLIADTEETEAQLARLTVQEFELAMVFEQLAVLAATQRGEADTPTSH